MEYYSLTIFKNIYDNKTNKRMDFNSWNEFEELLYLLSIQPLKNKSDAYLISPATYINNSTRANKNVINWAKWAAVDVDDHNISGNLEEELISKYGDYYFVCYSTASSTIEFPKFRLVFPLSNPVENNSIKKFWFALNSKLKNIGDKQTKDLSRMYYIPATYDNSNNFIFTNKGSHINPSELMEEYPFVEPAGSKGFLDHLPEDVRNAIIEYRKNKMDNKDKYSWTGLRDCPFVNKNIINQYKAISQTGWYHKMYQFMVSVAFNSIKNEYPISEDELEKLARELDRETGNWYAKRPLRVEAASAIDYAYRNTKF